jgi:UDPglucose 6-dehydrogenase
MKVTIFGTGYVGLVTGACFAEMGNQVLCVDVDPAKIRSLRENRIPIYEPGLTELVRNNHAAGRLAFTTDAAAGVAHGLFQVIAVGTPADEDGSADLKYVLAVARSIGEHIDNEYRIVIVKSTVPVGTADVVRQAIGTVLETRGVGGRFDVVSNPEFLKEGSAVEDFMKPDRIIVGTDNPRTEEIVRALYGPFNRNHDRLLVMDIRSAELTKYAANAMLATKISLMNEMANLAERLGADIEQVRLGMGTDPRIGYHFIYPGCGYGGSCFPKDVRALEQAAAEVGYEAQLLRAVEAVNERQKRRLFEMVYSYFDGQLQGRTFAVWGLAFKPNTNDLREAPSRTLIEALLTHGARVQGYDPAAMNEAKRIYGRRGQLVLCQSPEAALSGADALVVLTEWNAFRSPDFSAIKSALKQPLIFDGRNLYNGPQLERWGFRYYRIGAAMEDTRSLSAPVQPPLHKTIPVSPGAGPRRETTLQSVKP